MPEILEGAGALESALAADGEAIRPGRVYVAPPDHHLIVSRGVLRLSRGPHENRFRPSIDMLFRSAARAYGPRVVGVILTGYLDDGTVGLQATKKRGGVAVVQDPLDAEYPGMPRSALRHVRVDHCVPLGEMAALLASLAASPSPGEVAYSVDERLEIEANIAEQQMNTEQFLKNVERIGKRTTYTCPQCNGAIWQIGDEDRTRCASAATSATRSRRRCFSPSRRKTWRTRSERLRKHGAHEAAARHEDYARHLDEEVGLIRSLILEGTATKRSLAEGEREARLSA